MCQIKSNQTRSRKGQAQEFVIWTLVYSLGTSFIDSGYQLDSLSFRLLKPFFDNVLLEHVGLPHVLPLAAHLAVGLGIWCGNLIDSLESKFPFSFFLF